jgi:hypothetical protein
MAKWVKTENEDVVRGAPSLDHWPSPAYHRPATLL